MPGICGALSLDGRKINDVPRHMIKPLKSGDHDETYSYSENNISLGSSVNTLYSKDGDRPVKNETDEIIACMDGFIFNDEKLREELLEKGHELSSDLDDELVVHLYEEHGTGLVDKLEGKFTLFIYDKTNNEGYLLNDPRGSKRCYYFSNGDIFIFSSRIGSILNHPDIEPYLNYRIINWMSYFSPVFYYPKTYIENVFTLLPGRALNISEEGISVEQNFNYFSPGNDRDFSISKVESLLIESIKKRVSKFPGDTISIFLSGGIDSITLANLLRKIYPERKMKTYTVGTEDDEITSKELKVSQKVSEMLGAEHECVTEVPDLNKLMKGKARTGEDLTMLWKWSISELPDPGEILFTGYYSGSLFTDRPYWRVGKFTKKQRIIPHPFREYLYNLGLKTPSKKMGVPLMQLGSNNIKQALVSSTPFCPTKRKLTKAKDKRDLDFLDQYKNAYTMYRYLHTYMNMCLTADSAKVNSAKGLCFLSPFSDRKLSEYLFSVGTRDLMNLGGKKILNEILGDFGKSIEFVNAPPIIFGQNILKKRQDFINQRIRSLANRDKIKKESVFKFSGDLKKRRMFQMEYLLRYIDEFKN